MANFRAESGSVPARAFRYESATRSTGSSFRGFSRGQATITPTAPIATTATKPNANQRQRRGGRLGLSGRQMKTVGPSRQTSFFGSAAPTGLVGQTTHVKGASPGCFDRVRVPFVRARGQRAQRRYHVPLDQIARPPGCLGVVGQDVQ